MHSVTVWFDGACKPRNPGGTGVYGYLAKSSEFGETNGYAVFGRDNNITSNVAEYVGAIEAIKHALEEYNPDHIHVIGDSELVINQLKGEYDVRSSRLRPFYRKATRLIENASCQFQFQHIPREQNTKAHQLCELAYQNHLYRHERDLAKDTPLEIIARGDHIYEVDGERVELTPTPGQFSCTCSAYEHHGAKCIHVHKAELAEQGHL